MPCPPRKFVFLSKMCMEPPLPPEHPSWRPNSSAITGAGTDAASDRLTVIAISRDHVVVGAKHRHHAGGDRFLPDVEVAEAADLAECVSLGAALLEAALQQHRAEQLASGLGRRARQIVRRGIDPVVAGCAFVLAASAAAVGGRLASVSSYACRLHLLPRVVARAHQRTRFDVTESHLHSNLVELA